MKILIDVDEQTGNIQIGVDPPNVPPPTVSWILRKAEAAVFNPPPPSRVVAAPAGALRQIPGLNGQE